MSSKGLSKNVIAAIVTLIVIVGLIAALSMTPPGGPPAPGPGGGGGGGGGETTKEEAKVVIEDGGSVGGVGSKLLRMTIRNAGNVQVKITWIIVKDTDVEGKQIQGKVLQPGETAQMDVSLSKGEVKQGANTFTFIIQTDKGDFEQKFTITAG